MARGGTAGCTAESATRFTGFPTRIAWQRKEEWLRKVNADDGPSFLNVLSLICLTIIITLLIN